MALQASAKMHIREAFCSGTLRERLMRVSQSWMVGSEVQRRWCWRRDVRLRHAWHGCEMNERVRSGVGQCVVRFAASDPRLDSVWEYLHRRLHEAVLPLIGHVLLEATEM